MRYTNFHALVLCGCAMASLAGCNQTMSPYTATALGSSSTGDPPPPSSSEPAYSVGVSLSQPSVIVGTNGWAPTQVYHVTDSKDAPYASLEGCLPAVDGQGNVYMLAFQFPWGCGDFPSTVDVYSPSSVGGNPIRSVRVGPGTKVAKVKDLAVSPAGEIFVNDGSGVAVFSATANRLDAPVRYIQWDRGEEVPVTPGHMAADGAGNLYVQNGSSIAVFGPDATGLSFPSRVISGPHTQLAALGRMATDIQGNLYVTVGSGAYMGVGVLEFAAGGNGDVAPRRFLDSTDVSNFQGLLGVAVDSSGVIYLRATDPYCGAIFVFAAGASGNVPPLRVIAGTCPDYDIDGTIAIFQGNPE